MYKSHLAAALLLAMAGVCQAQEIEWKQTLNIAKGQNISRDRADMLGIEFGDTYAEAKAKLQKLASEGIQPKAPSGSAMERMRVEHRMQALGAAPTLSLREEQSVFQFRAPGHSQIVRATYVATIKLDRKLKGSGEKPIQEYITIHFSAPSSGHQVVALNRSIHYPEQDQPRVSEVLAQLKAKYKGEPQVEFGTRYVYQFNDGQPYTPPTRPVMPCLPATNAMGNLDGIRTLNKDGICDVVLLLDVNHGISRDHASALMFSFADNERIRANGTADYAFVQSYINSLQTNTRGTPPKL